MIYSSIIRSSCAANYTIAVQHRETMTATKAKFYYSRKDVCPLVENRTFTAQGILSETTLKRFRRRASKSLEKSVSQGCCHWKNGNSNSAIESWPTSTLTDLLCNVTFPWRAAASPVIVTDFLGFFREKSRNRVATQGSELLPVRVPVKL